MKLATNGELRFFGRTLQEVLYYNLAIPVRRELRSLQKNKKNSRPNTGLPFVYQVLRHTHQKDLRSDEKAKRSAGGNDDDDGDDEHLAEKLSTKTYLM